tara:strand:- start:33917 stop:34834 length:918 start_codon:yes stop_codon:yes gene_type:complete
MKLKIILMSLFISNGLLAQQEEVKLWEVIPGNIANKKYSEEKQYEGDQIRGYNKVSEPTLTIFTPEVGKANGTAVIICPGGGYSHLAINKEGYKLGEWFAEQGVTGFVLKNRLPNDAIMEDKTIGPLQDVQRAIRYVRQHAVKYHLDSSKVGVMGFSAGGHLAVTASTLYDEKVYESDEGVSAKPNFSVLIYPVVSMKNEVTHKGSRDNLLGNNPNAALIKKYSGEEQVTIKTPMTFLVHASDDGAVPVENSINYFLALKNVKVPVEMHIYEDGGHGFGMGRSTTADSWPEALSLWLKKHSFITN